MHPKMILITTGLLLFLAGCATLERTDPKLLVDPIMSTTISFQGQKADVIYKKSTAWVADTYDSAKAVITFQEPGSRVNGTGVGGTNQDGDLYFRYFRYNFSIEIKDEKARLSFSGVREEKVPSPVSSGMMAGVDIEWRTAYDAVKTYFQKLTKSYEVSIRSEVADW